MRRTTGTTSGSRIWRRAPSWSREAQAATTPRAWETFKRKYRAEMATPENARVLDLLAALSHQTNLSVGCYCAEEAHCHRSVLRELLAERDAEIV